MCELDPVYIGLPRDRILFMLIYNILKIINDKNIVKSDRQKEEIDKYLLKSGQCRHPFFFFMRFGSRRWLKYLKKTIEGFEIKLKWVNILYNITIILCCGLYS